MRLRALAAWLALGLPPCALAADWPEIQARGVLRVVAAHDSMDELFSFDASGRGIEGELIQSFADLQKLKVEYVPVDTTHERIPALLGGRADVIVGGVAVTEGRRAQVDFTAEVLPLRHLAVTRRPQPPVTTLEQLRQARVGTLKGSSWAEQVSAAGVPPANVETFVSASEVLAALREGRVTALVMSTAWAIVEQRKDPQMELGLFVGPALGQAWAVRKDAPLLRQALDDYLANVRRTPTWNRLVVKYYGEAALEVLRKSRSGS